MRGATKSCAQKPLNNPISNLFIGLDASGPRIFVKLSFKVKIEK